MIDDLSPGGGLRALPAILRHGLDARSIHRIHAALHPERPALVDRRRRLTWRETDREIDRLADALSRRFDIDSGSSVALTMENRAEYLVAWFALFRLGAAGVHVSYRSTPDELAYRLDNSGARVVLCSEKTRDAVRQVRRDGFDDLLAVDVDRRDHATEAYAYPRLLATADPSPPDESRPETEGTNIVYTSGTTGEPKGTVRDMTTLGARDLFCILDRLPLRAGDRHLLVAPLYHSGGQVFSLLNTALGATTFLHDHFDPERTLRTLSTRAIQNVFMVPTMIRRVLNLPESLHDACPTPDLRALVSGAAPFPTPLRRRAMQRFGTKPLHDFYGATELGWVTLIDGLQMRHRPGSVGRPIPGQAIRIVDDRGRTVPLGEVGEIQVRSPHTMRGYLHRGDDSERGAGWKSVEDLGRLDDEGYLYLAGRARDMIISGGVNLYPAEIEDVLVGHDDIEEVAVVGVDDPEWGERTVAFVVSDERLDADELEQWARRRLANYKIPKEWRFTDALPRTPTGKVRKTALEGTIEG